MSASAGVVARVAWGKSRQYHIDGGHEIVATSACNSENYGIMLVNTSVIN